MRRSVAAAQIINIAVSARVHGLYNNLIKTPGEPMLCLFATRHDDVELIQCKQLVLRRQHSELGRLRLAGVQTLINNVIRRGTVVTQTSQKGGRSIDFSVVRRAARPPFCAGVKVVRRSIGFHS